MLDGDMNTKNFQASVKYARLKNSLYFLVDEDGLDHFSDVEKGEIAVKYFKNLFQSSQPVQLRNVLHDFQPRVSAGMNLALCRKISPSEIRQAAFSINDESAPGPDGLTGFFFKEYWSVIKEQVISEVLQFFDSGCVPAEWNHTNLCLIPKIQNPSSMIDLRLISLCSVSYKIIAKILFNRLKRFLPSIISPTQAAFVSERMISDNILIAHEVIHGLHTHPTFSQSSMMLKTDMSKAYDKVEWKFLEDMLVALGFDPLWISWIMGCVTSVSYSVVINGQPFGSFKPERGIRQGDPLSLFLFVLCTEALIHIFNQAGNAKKVSGIQFNPSGPAINH